MVSRSRCISWIKPLALGPEVRGESLGENVSDSAASSMVENDGNLGLVILGRPPYRADDEAGYNHDSYLYPFLGNLQWWVQ